MGGEQGQVKVRQQSAAGVAAVAVRIEYIDLQIAVAPEPDLRDLQPLIQRELTQRLVGDDDLDDQVRQGLVGANAVRLVGLPGGPAGLLQGEAAAAVEAIPFTVK